MPLKNELVKRLFQVFDFVDIVRVFARNPLDFYIAPKTEEGRSGIFKIFVLNLIIHFFLIDDFDRISAAQGAAFFGADENTAARISELYLMIHNVPILAEVLHILMFACSAVGLAVSSIIWIWFGKSDSTVDQKSRVIENIYTALGIYVILTLIFLIFGYLADFWGWRRIALAIPPFRFLDVRTAVFIFIQIEFWLPTLIIAFIALVNLRKSNTGTSLRVFFTGVLVGIPVSLLAILLYNGALVMALIWYDYLS